jgi:hypothetical protein
MIVDVAFDEIVRSDFSMGPVAAESQSIVLSDLTESANQHRMHLKKAVETIAIVPKKGRLTLLARRLHNALLAEAQAHEPGTEVYTAPLQKLAASAGYQSQNLDHIKEALRRLVGTVVEYNCSDSGGSEAEANRSVWEASALVAHVRMVRAKGRVIVQWSYPPNLREPLMKPSKWFPLAIAMQNLFRTSASLALYELCLRYLGAPRNLTMRRPWQWWLDALAGNPERETEVTFKVFNHDVLKGAIKAVNTLQQDIEIELITHCLGRTVVDLQFRVTRRAQGMLDLEDTGDADPCTIDRIMRLGIKQPEALRICQSDEGVGAVSRTLDYVEKRQGDKKRAPLTAPAAYFKDALGKGYAKPTAPIATKAAPSGPSVDDAMRDLKSAFQAHHARLAKEMFEEQLAVDQEKALKAFASSELLSLGESYKRPFETTGLKNARVASAFFTWLAAQTWPAEPTDKDLLQFSLTGGYAAHKAARLAA